MWPVMRKREFETVTVAAHGRVLERVSFVSGAEAEAYKRGVRSWALEKGVLIGIWSQRAESNASRGAGFARTG